MPFESLVIVIRIIVSVKRIIVIVISSVILIIARELLEMEDWSDWDFLLNLSESDYPVKTQQELVEFLTNNRSMRFSFYRDLHLSFRDLRLYRSWNLSFHLNHFHYRESNFVKGHGREQDKFIKKQGLDKVNTGAFHSLH